jgi:hypothetical protein
MAIPVQNSSRVGVFVINGERPWNEAALSAQFDIAGRRTPPTIPADS